MFSLFPSPSRLTFAAALAVWALGFAFGQKNLPVESFEKWGVPQIESYTPRTTGLHDPVTSIKTLPNGDLAFLSQSQFISFDGTQWAPFQSLEWPNKTMILPDRSVVVGHSKGLARLTENRFSSYDIEPLTDLSDYPDSPLTINALAQARGHIFSLHGTYLLVIKPDGRRERVEFENWASSIFAIGDDIFITGGNQKLLNKWDWESQSLVVIQELLENAVYEWFIGVIPRQSGGVWLLTIENKVVGFDGEKTWLWPGTRYLNAKGITANCLIEVSADELLIGSNRHGALIFDPDGNLTRSVSKQQGLDDSAILSAGIDSQGGIWLSTKRSVSRVLINPQTLVFDEHHGLPESINVMQCFDDRLYLGAKSGIYVSQENATSANELFQLEFPLSGVSDIIATKNHLIVAAASFYAIDRQGNVEVLTQDGGTSLWQPSQHPDIVLAGSYQGATVFRQKDGKWSFDQRLPGSEFELFSFTETAGGELFASRSGDSVARIFLDDGNPRVESMPAPISFNGAWSFPVEIEGDVYINTHPVHKWDPNSQSFIPDPSIESSYGPPPYGFNHVYGRSPEKVWVTVNSRHGKVVRRPTPQVVGQIAVMNESLGARATSIIYDASNNAYIGGSFGMLLSRDPFAAPTQLESEPRLHKLISLNDKTELPTSLPNGRHLRLSYLQNSLRIEAELPHFNATNLHKFQFYIQGLDPDLPPAQSLPFRELTNIPPGSYTLIVNAVNSSGQSGQFSLPFTVATPWYLLEVSIAVYILVAFALIALIVYGYNRNQIRKSKRLAAIVAERTEEVRDQNRTLVQQAERLAQQNELLEDKTEELTSTTEALSTTVSQLQEMQEQLVQTARTAGKAEVAINVLHNVGNVLNSLNVSINVLNQRTENSNASRLRRISDLLTSQKENVANFLAHDARGRNVPQYLAQLSCTLEQEIDSIRSELEIMGNDLNHVAKIISAQQTHAKNTGIIETVYLRELCETALYIASGEETESQLEIINEIPETLTLDCDKHRLLDIILNLISNAIDAIEERQPEMGLLSLKVVSSEQAETIELHIKDNGIGIDPAVSSKLFQHGFTTKAKGHGFGLHSCANAAQTLGGKLALESAGLGKGAVAKITLPLSPPE